MGILTSSCSTQQCYKKDEQTEKDQKEKNIANKLLLDNSNTFIENYYDSNNLLVIEKHLVTDSNIYHKKDTKITDKKTNKILFSNFISQRIFYSIESDSQSESISNNENNFLNKNLDFINNVINVSNINLNPNLNVNNVSNVNLAHLNGNHFGNHNNKSVNNSKVEKSTNITNNGSIISYTSEKSNLDEAEYVYNDINIYLPDDTYEEQLMNISFEDSKHYFLIEDNIYKIESNLPKTLEELNLNVIDKQIYLPAIEDAINMCKASNKSFHRLDGIILTNSSKQLILLSEMYLFDFYYSDKSKKFFLNHEIKICQIDYMSLSHDETILIIHLIPKIGKNFIIIHENLSEAAGCIASSNLLDSQNISSSRKISIIYFNKNFEILRDIANCTDFNKYKEIMNYFLSEKINKLCSKRYKNYKYAVIRYKTTQIRKEYDQSLPKYADLLITSKELLILNYKDNMFEVKFTINLHNVQSLYLHPDSKSFSILELDQVNFEIFSESYASIYNLINELLCSK